MFALTTHERQGAVTVAYSPPPGQPYDGPQGQPYPPYQGPYSPYQAAPPTNGMAITSLVCGISSFVVGITFIPAIIFGHIAQRQIRRTGEQGSSLALAGLILGYVGGAIFFGLVLAVAVIAVKIGHSGSATHAVTVPFIRPAGSAVPPVPVAPAFHPLIVVMPFLKPGN
jgi:Domain of unknown function (DUF4190)